MGSGGVPLEVHRANQIRVARERFWQSGELDSFMTKWSGKEKWWEHDDKSEEEGWLRFHKITGDCLRRQIGLRSEGDIGQCLPPKIVRKKQCKREENMVKKQRTKLHKMEGYVR